MVGSETESPSKSPTVPTLDRRRSVTGEFRLREREQYLTSMRGMFGQTWTNAGELIVIEGAPGLGKTALLNAGCCLAREAGLAIIRARCSEHENETPYALVQRLLGPTIATELGGDDVHEALNSRLVQWGRVLLAIDDVQWADRESVIWLQYLARRLDMTQVHLAVAALHRIPGALLRPVDELTLEPNAHVFALQPLHEASTVGLINEGLGELMDADTARLAHRLTRGNPTLIVALMNEMAQREIPVSSPELSHLTSPAVMRWLLKRLSSQPPEARGLLEAVAILGADADLRLTAGIAGLQYDVAAEIADALADASILLRGQPLKFEHPLVCSSIYGEIPPARRWAGHVAAATLLAARGRSSIEIASHLVETEPQNEPWIALSLATAARHAGRKDASKYLQRAQIEISPDVDRADFKLALAEVEGQSGRAIAIEHFRRAAQLEHDPTRLLSTGLRLVERFQASPALALAVVEILAAEHCKGDVNDELRLEIELARAAVLSTASAARSLATRAPVAAVGLTRSSTARAVALHHALGVAAEPSAMSFAASVAAIEANMPSCGDDACDWLVAETQLQALTLLVGAGAHAMADPSLVDARPLLRAHDHGLLWESFSVLLAQSLVAQGRLEYAEELLAEVALCNLDGGIDHGPLLEATSLELAALQGEVVRPLPILVERGERALGLFTSTRVAEAVGRIHLLSHDWARALGQFESAGASASNRGVFNPATTMWRVGRCEALVGMGRIAEAEEQAVDNLLLARQYGAPLPLATALRTSAEFASGPERVALLEEALALLEGGDAAVERCRILIRLGSAHRESGDSIRARNVLRLGADLAVRIGATSLIESASDELHAVGARPRRLQLHGADSLTPAERRVVALAASGETNSAIAAHLFVGMKTVESHLAHAYRKLGIRSRSELPPQMTSFTDEDDFQALAL